MKNKIFNIEKSSFICNRSDCSRNFSKFNSYKKHLKEHIKETTYKFTNCPLCQEVFQNFNNFENHFLVHKIKDEDSTSKSTLKDENYICNINNCKMKFKYFSHFKEHIKRHLKLDSKQCSKCFKTFSKEFVIKNHISSHLQNRPYLCFMDNCNGSFINLSQLRFHIKSYHEVISKDEKSFEEKFNEQVKLNKEKIYTNSVNYIKEYNEFIKEYPIINLNGLLNTEQCSNNNTFINSKRHEKNNIFQKEKVEEQIEEEFTNEEKELINLLLSIKSFSGNEFYFSLIDYLNNLS